VVRGHQTVGLGGKLLAELGRDGSELVDLGGDSRIARRVRDRRHAGVVARRRRQKGGAADVDHLDGFVDRHQPDADLRCEVADVDGHQIDQADSLGRKLGELLRRSRRARIPA